MAADCHALADPQSSRSQTSRQRGEKCVRNRSACLTPERGNRPPGISVIGLEDAAPRLASKVLHEGRSSLRPQVGVDPVNDIVSIVLCSAIPDSVPIDA